MTSKEFITWMKGFTEGVHEYNVTPKQWDVLKDALAAVSDEPIRTSGYASITFNSGSYGTTATAYSYPSGSTLTYTNSNDKILLND